MHHCGFATARWTHQRDELACFHFNVHSTQGVHCTVSNKISSGHVFGADDIHLTTTCSPSVRPETISTFESPRKPTLTSRLSVEEPFQTCTIALSLPEACTTLRGRQSTPDRLVIVTFVSTVMPSAKPSGISSNEM